MFPFISPKLQKYTSLNKIKEVTNIFTETELNIYQNLYKQLYMMHYFFGVLSYFNLTFQCIHQQLLSSKLNSNLIQIYPPLIQLKLLFIIFSLQHSY